MIIVTQLYRYDLDQSKDERDRENRIHRHMELDTCLGINVNHEFVKKMVIFCERQSDIEHYSNVAGDKKDKIEFILFGKQPHYKDFFLYVRSKVPENEVVCFLASDIYLNFDVNPSFFDKFLTAKTVFGITRHEPTDKFHRICNKDTCVLAHSTGGCGDCFFFRTPLPPSLDIDALDHRQNRWGGECNFLHQFYKTGATVWNPCYQVKTIHLHKDSVYWNQLSDKVAIGRPYLPYAEPCPTDTNHCINRPVALYEPGTVQCFRCKAYPNIFCQWQNGGKDWTCSICCMNNEYDKQAGYAYRVPL